MNADGSGVRDVAGVPGANDILPSWSPDGSQIAFTSDRDGNNEIYILHTDGSGETRLTQDPADDEGAAWSPDSSQIAFTSDRDGNQQIYVMNADGTGIAKLTEGPLDSCCPTWQMSAQT
jgi:TolB protein